MPTTTPEDDDRTVIRPVTKTATGPVSTGPAPGSLAWTHTLPPGTRLGEFEITGLIGEGGFGIVYLAFDHSLERQVAIKEYMPSSLAARATGSLTVSVKSDRHTETFQAGMKSFINEARLLARFDHPALVKVHRFWEDNGTAYMVMPYYVGPTLKRALADMGAPPDEAWLRSLLYRVMDALALMHETQCYHRDVAPDNILLTATGPLLLDFGAARRVISDLSQALTAVLKPGYAPIEQYGDVPGMRQGPWTDLYALASVVHYAITGRAPMPSVERLMNDQFVPLAVQAEGRYSPAFLKAMDAALSLKPDARPQSIAELRALMGDEPLQSDGALATGMAYAAAAGAVPRTADEHANWVSTQKMTQGAAVTTGAATGTVRTADQNLPRTGGAVPATGAAAASAGMAAPAAASAPAAPRSTRVPLYALATCAALALAAGAGWAWRHAAAPAEPPAAQAALPAVQPDAASAVPAASIATAPLGAASEQASASAAEASNSAAAAGTAAAQGPASDPAAVEPAVATEAPSPAPTAAPAEAKPVVAHAKRARASRAVPAQVADDEEAPSPPVRRQRAQPSGEGGPLGDMMRVGAGPLPPSGGENPDYEPRRVRRAAPVNQDSGDSGNPYASPAPSSDCANLMRRSAARTLNAGDAATLARGCR